MKTVTLKMLSVLLLLAVSLVGACSKTTTVTVPLTQPATTITSPAITTTIPAVTVTLPSGVTTIAATTITVPAIVNTVPAVTVSPPVAYGPSGFLPDKPSNITQHAAIMSSLAGDCLTCHGPQASNQFPMAPSWNGAAWNSTAYTGYYYVIAGSLQDHTGRTAAQCLTCHAVVS
jgi:cytochrome c553